MSPSYIIIAFDNFKLIRTNCQNNRSAWKTKAFPAFQSTLPLHLMQKLNTISKAVVYKESSIRDLLWLYFSRHINSLSLAGILFLQGKKKLFFRLFFFGKPAGAQESLLGPTGAAVMDLCTQQCALEPRQIWDRGSETYA